jgi:phosphoribosylglycinamide formyltransferase-1
MFSFGWWSTGRDIDAVNLFDTVIDALNRGVVRGRFAYCFLSKGEGEGEFSDRLFDRCRNASIPVVSMSAVHFMPELRRENREKWRDEYHRRVFEKVKDFKADIVVLAGYMWVLSAEVCSAFPVINLHPAAPGGPAGTWQEVIWQLMESSADLTGVMMHLVTPELDKGPPVTFCTFSIKGKEWDEMWIRWERDREELGVAGVKERFGEEYPLFARIRAEGVKRELPLIVHTLASMSEGKVIVREGKLFSEDGNVLPGPYDLTEQIDKAVGT